MRRVWEIPKLCCPSWSMTPLRTITLIPNPWYQPRLCSRHPYGSTSCEAPIPINLSLWARQGLPIRGFHPTLSPWNDQRSSGLANWPKTKYRKWELQITALQIHISLTGLTRLPRSYFPIGPVVPDMVCPPIWIQTVIPGTPLLLQNK